jgi:pantothenate synthetase
VPDRLTGDLRLLVAARLPSARLIDNLGVTLTGTHRKDA